MPTYEYLCKSCGHRFEIWQKMSDESLTICPECGANIRRVVYPAGIVFKGSGFYKTDHGNGSIAAEAGSSTKSEESAPAKEGETKKPESGESKSGSESSSAKTSESKVAVESK